MEQTNRPCLWRGKVKTHPISLVLWGFVWLFFFSHRMVEVGRGTCVSSQPRAGPATANCLRAFSGHVWNTEDGDFTVSLGNLYQCLTTRTTENFYDVETKSPVLQFMKSLAPPSLLPPVRQRMTRSPAPADSSNLQMDSNAAQSTWGTWSSLDASSFCSLHPHTQQEGPRGRPGLKGILTSWLNESFYFKNSFDFSSWQRASRRICLFFCFQEKN